MEQAMKCPSCGKQLPSGMVFCPWDGRALEPMSSLEQRGDPLLQAQVSEYVIKERIGTGGMGIVYRAVQPLIGKQVAIKVLKAEYAEAQAVVQRLLVEARVVNAIKHRGIIDIFGFGQLPDGRPYFVMELLHGLPLVTFIRKQGRVGTSAAIAILDASLSALGAAHRENVIHRDLKPGNVFLVEESDGSRSVKLLDFGIAKVAQSQTIGPLTMSGHVLGTPEYMAPEQIRGERVEPTADLYAVGVIAFQMLTGRRPFIGEQLQVLFAQVEEEPPAPSSLVPDLPKKLESIVLRLLAKRPAQRFQSAEEVRKELDAFISKPKGSSEKETQASTTLVSSPVSLRTPPSITSSSISEQEPATLSPPPRRSKRWWLAAVVTAPLAVLIGMMGLNGRSREVSSLDGATAPHATPVPALLHEAPSPPQQQPAVQAVVEPAMPVKTAPAATKAEPATAEVVHAKATKEQLHESADTSPKSSSGVAPAKALELASTTKAKSDLLPIGRRPEPGVKTAPAKAPPAPVPSPPSVPESQPPTPSIRVDPEALLARLADATVRLRRKDEQAVASPAMARLMEIHRMADHATTDEQRAKVAELLDAWERKFLSNR
jgi:serine/threonine-protein kinase